MGFAEEFSTASLGAFAESFEVLLRPEELFELKLSSDGRVSERSATYWRWIGWKALRHANLVTRLRNALRQISPTAMLLIEVRQASLITPLQGLEQYGEDLAELFARSAGSVVVRHEEDDIQLLLERMGQRQDPMADRLWVGVSVRAAAGPPSIAEIKESILKTDDSGRRNLLIHAAAIDAVP